MITAGDESGHTQHGNNNPYCQDNELAWLDWNHDEARTALLEFTKRLLEPRRTEPIFRRRRFSQGRSIHGADIKDFYWLKPDGSEMSESDWQAGHARSLGMALPGNQIDEIDETGETGERGECITGDTFAILFNAHHEMVDFRLGSRQRDVQWTTEINTADPHATPRTYANQEIYLLNSLQPFSRPWNDEPENQAPLRFEIVWKIALIIR
jgi:glycogen operon protein